MKHQCRGSGSNGIHVSKSSAAISFVSRFIRTFRRVDATGRFLGQSSCKALRKPSVLTKSEGENDDSPERS